MLPVGTMGAVLELRGARARGGCFRSASQPPFALLSTRRFFSFLNQMPFLSKHVLVGGRRIIRILRVCLRGT